MDQYNFAFITDRMVKKYHEQDRGEKPKTVFPTGIKYFRSLGLALGKKLLGYTHSN